MNNVVILLCFTVYDQRVSTNCQNLNCSDEFYPIQEKNIQGIDYKTVVPHRKFGKT
jgi:hypothetical protein